jgi:hypothetical protein
MKNAKARVKAHTRTVYPEGIVYTAGNLTPDARSWLMSRVPQNNQP